MKVLAVFGSPHKNGPSTRVAKEILRGAKDAGHEVIEYRLEDMNVQGCKACGVCKRDWIDCIQNDDLKPYWKELHEADALVLAAPNYCSQVCGPMITYMNRHYCLMMIKDGDGVVRGVKRGIHLFGVFAQGQKDPNYAMDAYKWFLHDFEERHMKLEDILVHTGGMTEEEEKALMEKAYQDGFNLSGELEPIRE